MDINAIDLNLLKAFDALMVERGVTRAAARVGLSQPAMSHALTRLRALFKDELFVRTPAGLEPTARARDLAVLLEPALDGVRSALCLVAAFDPATTRRTFTAGMAEYAEIALIERLAERFEAEAPAACLRLVPVTATDYAERLDNGGADVALLHLKESPPRFDRRIAFREPMVVLARLGNPWLGEPLTLERYAALPHVLVSPRGATSGGMDQALADHGLSRRIRLYVATYLALPLALARSDLVATVPAFTAARIAAMAGLLVHPLPFARCTDVTMAWHRRTRSDPAQMWFREMIGRSADC